jgi:hypothetical protein
MKRLLLSIAVALAFAVPMRAADSSDAEITSLVTQAPGLRPDVLKLALTAATRAEDSGLIPNRNVLTVIDYSLPSSQPRLFIFDLAAHKLLFRELVAHGKGSGDNLANVFSNNPGSLATSLGLFVTADTYNGGNGYSLRLRGLEEGVNDMAWDRAIVMHGASYVSEEAVKVLGRLGRSWGCPAVRPEISQKIIDTIRGGTPIFAYYPDQSWLSTSAFLKQVKQVTGVVANALR